MENLIISLPTVKVGINGPPPLHKVLQRENAVIPAKAGIQILEIVVVSNYLDARFRGHDELRHSLQGHAVPRNAGCPYGPNECCFFLTNMLVLFGR